MVEISSPQDFMSSTVVMPFFLNCWDDVFTAAIACNIPTYVRYVHYCLSLLPKRDSFLVIKIAGGGVDAIKRVVCGPDQQNDLDNKSHE